VLAGAGGWDGGAGAWLGALSTGIEGGGGAATVSCQTRGSTDRDGDASAASGASAS